MGKKQHHKDKLWISQSEWSTLYGGKAASSRRDPGSTGSFRRLPFNYCAISLVPFGVPLCAPDGYIFDIMSIVPFLKKYGVHPVTGAALDAQQLIKLKFHKNKNDEYHCPVLFKVFNESTHIVAIRTTGNVFSYEAVETLNLKPKHFRDLLTDKPFTRQDIITLQDPQQLEKYSTSNFYHLKQKLQLSAPTSTSDSSLGAAVPPEARHALEALRREYKPPQDLSLYQSPVPLNKFADIATDALNRANSTTGRVAASFTSTTLQPQTRQEFARIDEDALRYARIASQKKKAYVRLVTNLGPLNFELYADQCPRTCENFVRHCRTGYYHGTLFHRLIRNFIVQGGDPTATGLGGESAFEGGKAFEDEIRQHLKHEGRGMLSMANSGPGTNKSQFFITFRSAKHLDGKHTVFGRLVGGFETLDKMEYVPVDKLDKPEQEVKVLSTNVFTDPYIEVDEQLQMERKKLQDEQDGKTTKPLGPISKLFHADDDAIGLPGNASSTKEVGKYLKSAAVKRSLNGASDAETVSVAPTSLASELSAGSRETQTKRAKFLMQNGNFNRFENW